MKASLQVSGLTLVLEPLGSANYDDEIERGLRDAIFAKKQVGTAVRLLLCHRALSTSYSITVELHACFDMPHKQPLDFVLMLSHAAGQASLPCSVFAVRFHECPDARFWFPFAHGGAVQSQSHPSGSYLSATPMLCT